MISIEEALDIIESNQPQLLTTDMSLHDALDRVLTSDIAATESLPRCTNSAMDGYAVCYEDFETATEGETVNLKVIGESSAGRPFHREVQAGEAVRINTGAMMPAGSDTVVPVEHVIEEAETIQVRTTVEEQQYVRFEGEEIREGETLIEQGTTLTPGALGLLASLGIGSVPVYRPPQTGIIITGDELVGAENEIEPWQIRDSNGVMLEAGVHYSGSGVTFYDRCGDSLDSIRYSIQEAVQVSNIVLICGGVSVGPHDLVKEAAQEEGFETLFWKVRQKPGKPLFFARKSDTLLFGLPGNPVSTLICYIYYVHPLLLRMQGRSYSRESIVGKLAQEYENWRDRDLFLQVRIAGQGTEVNRVIPIEKQDSHMLSSIALAQGFILVEAGRKLLEEEEVQVYLYPWRR